jgi:putative membrane protein
MAAQKGEAEAVRAFGRRMATDHAQRHQKLQDIAARENISLPIGLDQDAQQNYEKLAKLSGPAFDRSYAQDMVTNHKKDVAEFQKETKAGKNEAIRTFAAETLPYSAGPSEGSQRNQGRHLGKEHSYGTEVLIS